MAWRCGGVPRGPWRCFRICRSAESSPPTAAPAPSAHSEARSVSGGVLRRHGASAAPACPSCVCLKDLALLFRRHHGPRLEGVGLQRPGARRIRCRARRLHPAQQGGRRRRCEEGPSRRPARRELLAPPSASASASAAPPHSLHTLALSPSWRRGLLCANALDSVGAAADTQGGVAVRTLQEASY